MAARPLDALAAGDSVLGPVVFAGARGVTSVFALVAIRRGHGGTSMMGVEKALHLTATRVGGYEPQFPLD